MPTVVYPLVLTGVTCKLSCAVAFCKIQHLLNELGMSSLGELLFIGRVLDECWTSTGRVLDECWTSVGRVLVECWTSAGRVLDECLTSGR